MIRRFRINTDAFFLLALLSVVTLTWCVHYHRLAIQSWSTPPLLMADERWARWKASFSGDALWGMASTKALADGEISFFDKRPSSLGAPFRANWNDWLSVEEGLGAGWACLTRLFGLAAASNLALLGAHLLAGTSFYFVCRYLRYNQWFSFAGAAAFALSQYAFWRGLPHLGLTLYWHIPLGLLALWWCLRGEPVFRRPKKLIFCGLVAALHGAQSPYYTGMFAQFLVISALYCAIRWRDWQKVLLPVFMGGVVIATFLLMNVDTFRYELTHGANPTVAGREYFDVELWALKPVELLIPVAHSIRVLENWTNEAYFKRAMVMGEGGSPYLGIVGILSLIWLFWFVAMGIAKSDLKRIPLHFWCILWIFAYAMIGGATGILGLGGILVFRAANRYSVFILAVVLLFLVRQLTAAARGWNRPAIIIFSAALIAIAIFDQVPPRLPAQEKRTRLMLRDDASLVATMESKLPKGAMIFQLPIMKFPEGFAVGRMVDYEPFRPYLHSKTLRFSYGDDKGRYQDRWQNEADQLGGVELVRRLERYGFRAILINRKGYDGRPVYAQEDLRDVAQRSKVIARSNDFVCLALNPVRHPSLPPEFAAGWHPLEGSAQQNIRWSSGDASLILHNPEPGDRTVRLAFGLSASDRRYLEISRDRETFFEAVLDPGDPPRSVELTLTLSPGRNEFAFVTDRPGEVPLNGDTRKLAYALINFNVL